MTRATRLAAALAACGAAWLALGEAHRRRSAARRHVEHYDGPLTEGTPAIAHTVKLSPYEWRGETHQEQIVDRYAAETLTPLYAEPDSDGLREIRAVLRRPNRT